MKEIYKSLGQYGEDEIIINKSRFIGYGKPIKDEEEALDFINEIKTKHYDATHNVYAYHLGDDVQRFSDDGEPSGTAGIPVLEVIKKEELKNVVIVVTRYFGGVKLGGGGLIRAYTRGAKIAIDAAKIVDMTMHTLLKMTIPYTPYGKIENFLRTNDYVNENLEYLENVIIRLYVANEELENFEKNILDLTSGDAIIERLDEKHIPLINGYRFG